MLNKKTVKAQCRKQFKEPLSSTQYIAFQKSHPEFPSYLRLKNLYGSWDAFCLSTWGKGGELGIRRLTRIKTLKKKTDESVFFH